MLTPKQRGFLETLHRTMEENPSHGFAVQCKHRTTAPRLILKFPYGTGIKSQVDKDHRNFDHKIDALFNKKLNEAMQVVVYFNSLFPEATEMTKDIVVREMKRQGQREKAT
ncbi:hypothetical protein ACFL6C_10640 [Myxococcota bacterium]